MKKLTLVMIGIGTTYGCIKRNVKYILFGFFLSLLLCVPSADTLGGQVGIGSSTLQIKSFESPEYAVAATASTQNVAHNLGANPTIFYAVLRCKTADLNYSVGDEVFIANAQYNYSSNSFGANTTNIFWAKPAYGIYINNKTTGAITVITYARWMLVLKAYRIY